MSSAPENNEQVHGVESLESVRSTLRDSTQGLARSVAAAMQGYAERPALGERVRAAVTDTETGRTTLRLLPRFNTVTYAELWDRAGVVAAEWASDPQHPVGAGDFVVVCGFTSIDYVVLDLACLRLGAVAVPLQSSAAVARLRPIVTETEPRVVAASADVLDKAVELVLSSDAAPRLVVFDHHPEADDERESLEVARGQLEDAGHTAVDTLTAVIERGSAIAPPPLHHPAAADDDSMRLLIYTSGSTGAPKGAIYTERMLKRHWSGWPFVDDTSSPTTINYMPLSHMAGRSSVYSTLGRGGTAYFTAKSDNSTLFEDIALTRPTQLLLVPRICDTLFQEFRSELGRRAEEFGDAEALDAAVKADLRERVFGGRVREVMCGSAPLAPELRQFVESCLRLGVHDGYGATEVGAITLDSRIQRPPVIEYKLVDVSELGYFSTDRPYPRGELLLKTEDITPGYYKRPDTTAAVFDEDGFYKTGDIMAQTGPDQLVYVDRRNNVQKLSQGEFVAISRLESVFVTSPLIRQIYVYGNSERAYLLGVVVPTDEVIAQTANPGELKRVLGEALQQVARQAELEPYEVPRDFLVETAPFTVENGLLSGVRKNLRPELKARYGDRLEALYAQVAGGLQEELRALRDAGPDQPVFEAICRGAAALLGCSAADLNPTARFTDLGVDSLSALSFSRLLQDMFEVEVPVGILLSPGNNLKAIAGHIESARDLGARSASCASVHGRAATVARAADLTLEKFIDADTLCRARRLSRPRPRTDSLTVLLTGANGYLGRFMCLDWLERVAADGGRLICVVRGRDDADARQRLDASFDTGDAELLRHYRDLAARHLDVLAGDIGQERLGLAPDAWKHLAEDIDFVFHPAALVNHVLPYDQLFGPNVTGTAELIRLALTEKIKPFTYLSTAGVATGLDPSRLDEEADIRVVSPERNLSDGYADGYATSKWAGEVLLREAHETYGLPVTTLRSDMILAHRSHTGQLNVPDMFTRLLFSLVTTGIAPGSFYRGDDKERRRAHYDGLPVDFVARAVNALGVTNTDGHRTYNVVNPHDDGISLDTFVDWLIGAGHPIHRIDDYDTWFSRFETALKALPERKRQYSSLPLLHAYRQQAEPVGGAFIPADRFAEAVRDAGIGREGIPHLTAGLIIKYAADLRRLGLI
ncbi:carboxylic acid reductase [Streptomyces fuscichromogenes]|uniref:carboxylic acid reductase n=1 Tax=Streptomyces fuscichromogenes TaxID=1324013 RepID=UPI0038016BF4